MTTNIVHILKVTELSTEPKMKKKLFSNSLGHERPDVVEHRGILVQAFLANKPLYWQVNDAKEDGNVAWIEPFRQEDGNRRRRILLCHDESTFRSGETAFRRWLMPGREPFVGKGS